MEMPTIRPIPIKTKGQPVFIALWRWITSIRKWEVINDWSYILEDGTKILVPKGFVFNGASVPRIFWALLSPVGILLIPALLHDYAYQYDELKSINSHGDVCSYKPGEGRGYWDKMFKDEATRVNGLSLINTVAWFMLFLFGCFAWDNYRKTSARG